MRWDCKSLVLETPHVLDAQIIFAYYIRLAISTSIAQCGWDPKRIARTCVAQLSNMCIITEVMGACVCVETHSLPYHNLITPSYIITFMMWAMEFVACSGKVHILSRQMGVYIGRTMMMYHQWSRLASPLKNLTNLSTFGPTLVLWIVILFKVKWFWMEYV